MNLSFSDSLLSRQRTRSWSPVITQQVRLRHVYQIFGLNYPHLPRNGAYYFTLHLTSMSAPFYTSEKLQSPNPKWAELDQRSLPNLGATAVVIRVWKHTLTDPDKTVSTWGVNLSGLVYLGNKVTEVQPPFFLSNSVIFNIRGSFFTSHDFINTEESPRRAPFLENVNIKRDHGGALKVVRKTSASSTRSELRQSYTLEKLQRLQSLQMSIKNRTFDVQGVREKIKVQLGGGEDDLEETRKSSPASNIRYAPQLLTMKSVNKMLAEKPTRLQRQEMEKIRNQIEIVHFKNKLLSQERDKKYARIRRCKAALKNIVDLNEDKSTKLTEDYYNLHKDMEKFNSTLKTIRHQHKFLVQLHSQLDQRRRQLLQQLLFVYPIEAHRGQKYTIHGIFLPHSDKITESADNGISVALGYVTHTLVMSSIILQVPLRYTMVHYGSRSQIHDHVSSGVSERDRDFPLFTKGKESYKFTYGVYLLNKNIAQLRWLFFMETPELKATLPNLMSFLMGNDARKAPSVCLQSLSGIRNEIGPAEEHFKPDIVASKKFHLKFLKPCESGPGLSEILAIPEAYLNSQISSDSFKNFAALKNSAENMKSASIVIKQGVSAKDPSKNCDNSSEDTIDEEGTDPLNSIVNFNLSLEEKPELEEAHVEEQTTVGEAVHSDSNIETVENISEAPLTARTDALLNTKSFNLIRAKPSL